MQGRQEKQLRGFEKNVLKKDVIDETSQPQYVYSKGKSRHVKQV